jgi:hypothetical protein
MIGPASAHATRTQLPVAIEDIGVKLADPPPSSLTNPLARAYLTGALQAGGQLTAAVEVSNSTNRPQTISLYVAAASMHAGVFSFADGHSPNELARWTALSNRRLRLAAGKAAIVGVRVHAATGVSQGERYAVVWAAVEAPGAGPVRLVNRVGMRMYLTVGGAAPSRYTVSRPKGGRSRMGTPLVTTTIHNSGTRTLSLAGSITLIHGPGGLRIGPITVRLARPLAPGATRTLSLPMTKQLPRGPWHARLALTSGSTERISSATIAFPPVRHGGT